MLGFRRNAQGEACLAGLALGAALRDAGVPTPAYCYDLDGIAGTGRALVEAMGPGAPAPGAAPGGLVAYAVKANTAGTILRALAREGLGADVVSGGELRVALACGIPARRIVMSGVAKTDAELDLALGEDIFAVQAESLEELDRIAARARALGRRARVALRVNPAVSIDSHAHIATGHDEAKFGIARQEVGAAWERVDGAADALVGVGISTHVGSMLAEPGPYLEAARVVCELARARRAGGARLEYVDFGGGYGVDYGGAPCVEPAAFVRAARGLLTEAGLGDLALVVEPGRALVAPFGVLVARVVQAKRGAERSWLMIDAGMNDLIRPALYAAHHRIEPLDRPPGAAPWRVVGPVCESSDDFGEHPLGEPPEAVVIRDAGAYGFTMASEYNGRPLPAEVFLAGGRVVHVAPSPGVAPWVERRLRA